MIPLAYNRWYSYGYGDSLVINPLKKKAFIMYVENLNGQMKIKVGVISHFLVSKTIISDTNIYIV